MAVIGLLGILSVFTFLEQIEDVQNDYTLLHVGRFVLYSMPRMFYETVPYAALIGCLAGLGLLANNSELTVMRMAGVSTWRITWYALKPAILLTSVGLLVGEYILPDFERVARIDRVKALSAIGQITPGSGFWQREGRLYIHFTVAREYGVLERIRHYEIGADQGPIRTLYADRATFKTTGNGKSHWLLEHVTERKLIGDDQPSTTTDRQIWRTSLTPDLISAEILVLPDKMSISELSTKIEYLRNQGLNSGAFELGFWQKVLQPLATLSLVLVGISFVFGPLREATMGMRLVSGLMIGIMFRFAQNLLSPASLVYGFPPLVAIVIPILICTVVGCHLIRRAN
jgi:lipopolysaccharide export system permease protein